MRHEKAASLLKLAQILASNGVGLTLDEIATEMEVGRRTAERMRDAVRDLFPTFDEVNDPPTKRYLIKGGLSGFFRTPTTSELVELSKAVTSLRAAGAIVRSADLASLELKIRAAMKGRALDQLDPDIEALARVEMIAVEPGPKPFEDREIIAVARDAILSMKPVRFQYLGGRRRGISRDVIPFGLMFGRTNYLVGAELGSQEPKNYRMDRIRDIAILDQSAPPPADFDLREYAARSFGLFQGKAADVALRFLPAAAPDALRWRFHPKQLVEPQTDGSVIVRFTASGLQELVWHLFTWRDQVEILEPIELKSMMVEELKVALEQHRASAGSVAE